MIEAASNRNLSRRGERILVGVLVGLFLLCVGGQALIVLRDYGSAVQAAGPNTNGEAGKVFFAKRFADGEGLFLKGDEPPYYPAVHGALFHAVVGILGKAAGAETVEYYYIGRAVSVGLTLVALWLSGLILRRLGAGWVWMGILIVGFVAVRRVTQHSISFRPDNWLLCNAMLTCYMLARWPEKRWALALAAVTPVVGFWIKAPSITLAGAVVGVLVLERRWKEALICGGASAGLWVASIAAVNAISGGMFLGAMDQATKVPYEFGLLLNCLNVPQMWWALVLPALLWFRAWPATEEASRVRLILTVFWAVTMLTGVLTASRIGANSYYFIECFVFGLILVLDWIGEEIRSWRHQEKPLSMGVAAVVILFCLHAVPWGLSFMNREYKDIAFFNTERFASERQAIAELVNREGLRCYSDDPGLNVLLDHPVVIQPLVVTLMIEAGGLPKDTLIRPVQMREIDLIVWTGSPWRYRGRSPMPENMQQAARNHYGQDKRYTQYVVLRPRISNGTR